MILKENAAEKDETKLHKITSYYYRQAIQVEKKVNKVRAALIASRRIYVVMWLHFEITIYDGGVTDRRMDRPANGLLWGYEAASENGYQVSHTLLLVFREHF